LAFTQEFIDKVRDANNIVDIISEHSELKKSGSGLVGLCPFPSHKEKTASFSVSDLKQAYFCFGCQKAGNVFTFLREMRGMSFPEAIEYLAERAHLPIPDEMRKGAAPGVDDQRKNFAKINRVAALFYAERLAKAGTSPANAYITKRGLTPELVKDFELGVSGHTNELTRHLTAQKIPMDLSEQLGLVKKSRDGNGYYDMFRDRLMFPIVSASGNYIGFGGRVLDDSLPKYLNSPETPVFSKGKTLYGLNETAKFIRTEDSVLVVEGYMDFLGLYGAGIRNVVATLGTAMTREHAHILKRQTKNVIVLFDGDSAGQKAAFRSLPILLAEGLFPRAVTLPNKLDPDDFVKAEGADALRGLLRTAPELFFKFLDELMEKFGRQPSDKVHLINEVAPVLRVTSEEALRDLYMAEVARRLNVESAWLRKVLEGKTPANESFAPKNVPRAAPRPQMPAVAAKPVPKKAFPREEKLLINLALWRKKYLESLIEFQDLISNTILREVLGTAAEAYRQSPQDFDKLTVLLLSKFEDPEKTSAITDHLNSRVFNFSDDEGDKLFRDCLNRLKENAFKIRAKDLIQGLKSDQDNSKLEQFVNEIKNRSVDLPKSK
jgi:DNA primase